MVLARRATVVDPCDVGPARTPDKQRPVVDTAQVRFRKNPGTAISLVLCGHPQFALLVAVGVAAAAALSGRTTREVGLVLVTVLLGRITAGWLNDVADRERDIAVDRQDKPIARDWIHPSTVTFAVACLTLLVIPLSVSNGTQAGVAHLLSVLAAWLYCTRIKITPMSWMPWAISFGMFPAFLSYGGWGGGVHGGPPVPWLVLLAALLGVGLHVALALPDLVGDNRNGVRSLPMVIALRIGAAKLLYATVAYLVLVGAGIVVVGLTAGLRA